MAGVSHKVGKGVTLAYPSSLKIFVFPLKIFLLGETTKAIAGER